MLTFKQEASRTLYRKLAIVLAISLFISACGTLKKRPRPATDPDIGNIAFWGIKDFWSKDQG